MTGTNRREISSCAGSPLCPETEPVSADTMRSADIVMGNGRTAIKYSLNRYNQIRTTGIAANYNPFLSQTVQLPWRDINRNDIAEGERGCTGYPRVGCEIDFTTLSSNFGIAALNEYGNYPRTWNLESALEVQHELVPRLSVSGSCPYVCGR